MFWLGLVLLIAFYLLFSTETGKSVINSVVDTVNTVVSNATETLRISSLVPSAQSALADLRATLETKYNLRTFVGQTIRTATQEKELIESGKTSGTLTHSWHEVGRAIDLYPYNPDTNRPDMDGSRVDLFRIMHNEAANQGWRGIAFNPDGSKRLITNSKGKKIWDGGHLEWREGLTWDEAFAKLGNT